MPHIWDREKPRSSTLPHHRTNGSRIIGTRITVYDILEYLAGGMTEQEILEDFPALRREHVNATLAFAAQRQRERRLAE